MSRGELLGASSRGSTDMEGLGVGRPWRGYSGGPCRGTCDLTHGRGYRGSDGAEFLGSLLRSSKNCGGRGFLVLRRETSALGPSLSLFLVVVVAIIILSIFLFSLLPKPQQSSWAELSRCFCSRNALRPGSLTTAVTGGTCSCPGIVRRLQKTTPPRSPRVRGGFTACLSPRRLILPRTPIPAVPCAELLASDNGAVLKVFSGSCSSCIGEARRRRSDSAAISCV